MAEKLNMTSDDIIEENIDYIASRFPNALKEIKDDNGKLVKRIDFDILKQELSNVLIDDKKERYQMTWPDKKKSILLANSKINGTLRPVKEKSVDFDNTQNLYIEGDNLDVLKLLRETYLGKIKMIYIDPPYNTGNDFVYEDDFAQSSEEYLSKSGQYDEQGNRLVANNESNGRFHTDWLNMMYPRLKVARDLLTEDGVIFISIDDNELKNLIKITDDIFGEKNYIGLFTVENNPKGRKNSKFISVSSEYCLVYAKNINLSYFIESIPKNASDLNEDENGNFVHNSGRRVLVGENYFNKLVSNFNSDKHYSVYYRKMDNNLILKNETSIEAKELDLINNGYDRYISFRDGNFVENTYTKVKFKELFKNDLLDFKNDKIYEKNTSTTIRIKSLLVNREYDAIFNNKKIKKVYDFKTTSAGTKFKELFNTDKSYFTAPKNICLIKTLIELFDLNNCKDFSVLDFFSGSATTAEAVMNFNLENDSKIRFVLVQIPEEINAKDDAYEDGYKTICDIGEERIRRAGKKIKDELIEKKNKAGLLSDDVMDPESLDIGFRVLKLDSSNMNDVYYNPSAMTQSLLEDTVDNIKPDRTSLDLLFQVMLELGIELSAKITEKEINGKNYYQVNDNDIVACFDDNLDNNILTEIAKLQPLYAVFKDSSFSTDSVGINNEQIFKTYSPGTKIKVL